MATLRGSSTWRTTGKSWPGGSQVGDLAIFVSMYAGDNLLGWFALRSWRTVGRYQYSTGGDARWSTWHTAVYSKILTAQDLSGPVPSLYGQVLVLTGTPGTGTVRTGIGSVTGRALGGVLSVSWTANDSATDLDSGPDWRTPAGVVSQPSIYGPVSARTVVGWSALSSDGLAGDGRHGASLAIEVLPPVGPGAPTVLAPSDGVEVTSSGTVEHEWQHRPSVSGGYQDAYRLRADGGAGWRYWDASTGAYTASTVTNSSSVQTVAIPASAYTAMVGYDWQVQTREGLDGQWSPWSPASSLMAVTPPSVVLTGPSAVHNDLTPTITWTASTPRGVQTGHRVQIVGALSGVVVHDSGWRPGAASSWTVPVQDWENPGSYKRRVRVQQTGGSQSLWVEEPLTITWDSPAVPTVTAVAQDAGVEVTVSVSSPTSVLVERIGPDGIWVPLLPATEVTSELKITDVFAPYQVATAYRARAVTVLDGQHLASDWGTSSPVTSTDRNGYIALASNPTGTWLRTDLTDSGPVLHVEPSTVTYGLGDTHGRVTYGPGQGRAGELTLGIDSRSELNSLLSLLTLQRLLVFRWPADYNYDSDSCPSWGPGEVMTIARSSAINVERLVRLPIQDRDLSFEWIEQPSDLLGTDPDTSPPSEITVVADGDTFVIYGPTPDPPTE